MSQSHLGIFCHPVAGLREEVSYLPLKNLYFRITCQMSTIMYIFKSYANHSFEVTMKLTSRSRKTNTVLDNIANAA